ncbi:MAG: alpha-L-arabinofuranosidase [Clostridia bacterium]|nr:alpha-L-arabinofuranosidase [Clostridia bacterium]
MATLKIDTNKKHKISPYLYMQFMEPLGVADASVDAAWDFVENDWFPEVIDKVRELGPTMVRFGGCFASYYHWQEAIGPMKDRVPMVNYAWSGLYHNRVGTHEFLDFCRRVNAEPLIVANMESEGLDFWQHPKNDTVRMGTAAEAAAWVDYCNNPNNAQRIANGAEQPFGVKYWQVGNETSYRTVGYRNTERHCGFTAEGCYETTQRFAAAMRQADPSIKLIGWGDNKAAHDGANWCKTMSEADVDMIAFHHHFGSGLENSPLRGTEYRDNYECTWIHLMHAHKSLDSHISLMRENCGNKRLAMTEGHFMLPGRNRNEVLSSWGAGVAYARCLNTIMRHSDVLDIATMADFFGNVWQVNALMLPTPIRAGKPYLQPVGAVMSLFGHHQGEYALDAAIKDSVDVVASATGDTVYLHVANTDMRRDKEIELDLGGKTIESIDVYYIAENPATEITPVNTDVFAVKHTAVDGNRFTLPRAAVAAVEIKLKKD